MKTSDKSYFDPKTAFFSLPIVKWTIRIGIGFIAVVCLLIALFSSRQFDFSAEGFNELLDMLKFPTFILGFFAALLALFATNHRSEQNKAAMNLAESQNRFSNYYKHIEEYENYLEIQFKGDSTIEKPIINIRKLHRCLYPNAKNSGIIFSSGIQNEIFKITLSIIKHIYDTNYKDKNQIESMVHEVNESFKGIIKTLNNSVTFEIDSAAQSFYMSQSKIEIPQSRLKEFIKRIFNKLEVVNTILHFEENFEYEYLNYLIENSIIAINLIPDISISGAGVIDWHPKLNINLETEILLAHEKMNQLKEKMTRTEFPLNS